MPTAVRHDPTAPAAPERLASVYREHFSFVWRCLRRLGLSDADAEDAAQDVFLVVRRRLPDFDASRPMRPWLFGIVRRVAADRRRSAGRTQRRLTLLGAAPTAQSPEHDAARNQALAIVERFLSTLEDDWRAVFVLGELEGLEAQQIADALELPRNTVYSRQKALRRKFQLAIDAAGSAVVSAASTRQT